MCCVLFPLELVTIVTILFVFLLLVCVEICTIATGGGAKNAHHSNQKVGGRGKGLLEFGESYHRVRGALLLQWSSLYRVAGALVNGGAVRVVSRLVVG